MSPRASWWVPPALLALAFIPVAGGTGRLIEVLGGPQVLPADGRFAASPVPLVVHIVAAVVYAMLGAFQFSARLRRRHSGWHRRAGRLLVVLGLAVAFSGLWMTLAYPQKEGTGDLLWVTRLLVSSAMGAAVVLGLVAIRRRDIAQHRAWMTRAYALALGAGTQAFTVGFGEAVFGAGAVNHDLMMASAWAINLAVAEWIIRRPAIRRAKRARHPRTALARSVMTSPATRRGHVVRAAHRWSPGRALVDLVRRLRADPRGRRDEHPSRRRARPVRAARPARQGPRPRDDAHLTHPGANPGRLRGTFPVTATSLANRS